MLMRLQNTNAILGSEQIKECIGSTQGVMINI